MPEPRQFILPFSHQPHFAAEDFVASASNEQARAWLARPQSWPYGRLVLSGPAGCGKTHLLHMWSAQHHAEIRPAQTLRGMPAPPQAAALAIDDADEAPDEASLFHLLNLAAESGTLLLLTARAAPALWHIRLPDLASRLRASAHVAIAPADDELLRTLLARLASDRQLIISPALADFMLLRLPRTSASLREAVARLDRAAMALGGRPTRALAAGIIAEITSDCAEHIANPGSNCQLDDNPMIFDPRLPASLNASTKTVRSHP